MYKKAFKKQNDNPVLSEDCKECKGIVCWARTKGTSSKTEIPSVSCKLERKLANHNALLLKNQIK